MALCIEVNVSVIKPRQGIEPIVMIPPPLQSSLEDMTAHGGVPQVSPSSTLVTEGVETVGDALQSEELESGLM